MFAKKTLTQLVRRLLLVSRALLPFVFFLFFCPEPVQPEVDDYLPSAPARLATTKFARAPSPVKGEKPDNIKLALAIGGVVFTTAFQRAFVLIDPSRYLLRFYFVGNRLVRSPPRP